MKPDRVYTKEERAVVTILREVMERVKKEPELPGGIPGSLRRLLEVDPEHVLRSTVRATKKAILDHLQQTIDSLGRNLDENGTVSV